MQNNLAQWLDTLPTWCKELKDALATQAILTAPNQELFEIYKARVEVFVVEQNCAYPEVDDNDLIALHLFAKNSQKLTAYCRIIPKENGVAIGRVLVAKANRGTGLARELMQKALEISQQHWQNQPIYVQAQAHLQGFYQSLGFQPISEIYLEDDIPHLDMVLSNEII